MSPVLWRRLFAYLTDCLLLFAALLVLQAALYAVNPMVASFRRGDPIDGGQLHLWVSATTTVPFVLYFAWMIASARQATVAMGVFGLRVVDLAGRRVTFPRALLRSAILLVPFELNHTVMFQVSPGPGQQAGPLVLAGIAAVWVLIAIYFATAAVWPRGQSVHDRIAGTVVVTDGSWGKP